MCGLFNWRTLVGALQVCTLQLVGKWKNTGKNRENTLKWTWRISWWRMLTLRCEDVQLDYRTTLQIPQKNCKSTKILRQDTILIPFCRVLGGSRYRYVVSIPIISIIIYHVLPLLYLYCPLQMKLANVGLHASDASGWSGDRKASKK